MNCITKLTENMCEFQDLISGRMIGNAELSGGLYLLRANDLRNKGHNISCVVSSHNKDSAIMLWHYRLGHPNFVYLKKLFPSLFNKDPLSLQCEVCQFSKHVRNSYPYQSYKPTHPFYLIHSDVWGPSRVNNISGSKWFVTFIDDHSRMTWVFLMKHKTDVTHIFQTFHKMIENQFKTKVQVLKTDNGKEFFQSYLGNYLRDQGIIHLSSCIDTPQQNGVAERKNRHILEVARSLMFATHVPKKFWGEAVLTTTYLINRMPSRVLKFQTPFQILLKSHPHISFLSRVPSEIFGCTSFVHVAQHNRSKLDPKSLKCIFLGYSSNQSGYKCYSPQTLKFYNSMDMTFFENQPFYPKANIL